MKRLLLFVMFVITFVAKGHSVIRSFTSDGLTYECDSDSKTARVTNASGITGKVIIPSSVTFSGIEYSVTAIGENIGGGGLLVFYNSNMTELVISEGVEEICANALSCRTLEVVKLPQSLTTIGGYAFNGCVKLKDIVLQDGVETIGDNAFLGCSSLESINIPKTIKTIGYGIFAQCSLLNKITVSEDNPVYDSRNNCNAIVITASNELIQGCQTTVIPSDVERIGDSAFAGVPFTEFVIPDHITSFGTSIFEGCSELKSVSLSKNMKEITRGMFAGCSSLKIVDVPEGVTTIGDYAFQASGLVLLTIPISVTSIGKYIVALCDGLKSVYVNYDNPEMIDNKVFMTYDRTTWKESGYVNATLYVPEGTKGKYETTEGWKDFEKIAEVLALKPVENETIVNMGDLAGQVLTDNMLDGIYYNLGNEGFDAVENCIIIDEPTDMEGIIDRVPGSEDIKSNYSGMILKVARGIGSIILNAKTSEKVQLAIKLGDEEPMLSAKVERGDVIVNYDVKEDTYVYIYAVLTSSEFVVRRALSDDVAKIYSFKVCPGTTGVSVVGKLAKETPEIYSIDGRKMADTSSLKGLYIVNGRKAILK